MNSTIERLLNLRVENVMRRDVVQLSDYQSMPAAANMLAEHGISGAPVTDSLGHCVGVLSASDFMRREQARGASDRLLSGDHVSVPSSLSERPVVVERTCDDLVSGNMSTAVQTVSADMLLLDAARRMSAAHIHRLPVLDAAGRVIGIMTSLDVVAAMIAAVEE